MKAINLTCVGCGKVRFTKSRAPRCSTCAAELLYETGRARLRSQLEALGCVDVKNHPATDKVKVRISYTHSVCGTEQSWQASNITKRLAAEPTIAPCSHCGGQRRWANGTKAFIEKYGRDYDIAKWDAYQRLTRKLSDQNYRRHRTIINPMNHPRSKTEFHLDHKQSIFEGFKLGLEPSFMARVENLQMLPATENISKGWR